MSVADTEIIAAVEEMIARFTVEGLPMWPESQALLDIAPREFAIFMCRVLGVGNIRYNRIKCLDCGDIVESKNRHDFAACKCGKSAADGGTQYLRRMGSNYEDRSEYWPWVTQHAFEASDA